MAPRLRMLALGLVAAVTLSGCAYDDYYGGGVSVGYGSAGYYDPYGYSYGYPTYGWYDGYYYPGHGYYVYDRSGHRRAMRDHDRRYWGDRHAGRRDPNRNWSNGNRDGANRWARPERSIDRPAQREARSNRWMEGQGQRWQQRTDRPSPRAEQRTQRARRNHGTRWGF